MYGGAYEAGDRRARFGAFLQGILAGVVVSAAVALVAILTTTPPEPAPPPGGAVRIDQTQPLSTGSEPTPEAAPAGDSVAAAPEGEAVAPAPEAPASAAAGPTDPGDSVVVDRPAEPEASGQPPVAGDPAHAPADATGGLPAETAADRTEPAGTADGSPTVAVVPEPRGGDAETAAVEPETDAAAEADASAPAGTDAATEADASAPAAPGAATEADTSAPADPDPVTDASATPEAAAPQPGPGPGARFVAAPDPQADPNGAPAEREPERGAAAEADEPPAAVPQPEPAGSMPADDAAGAAEGRGDAAAPVANAQPFDAPRGAPLMAVMLVGEGVGALSAEQLQAMPMPLAIAIPQGAARAAEIAAAARAAGHEVVADLAAPGGPSAGLAGALETAVGATATGGGGAGPELLEPVMAELGRRGLAWIDSGAGIGSAAERIARETGAAYTQANRTVPAGADAEQVRRGIEAAAHQARQWGTSVLLLGTSEAALQGLVAWGLEQGSGPVRFAPVSAVIGRRAAF